MNEIDKINLSEQTNFRLSEIFEIENYFHQEINQKKSCCKKLNKYVTAFDYIDKILIVSSATSNGVCIISSATVVGVPAVIASINLTLIFSLTNRKFQKIINHIKKQKEKA